MPSEASASEVFESEDDFDSGTSSTLSASPGIPDPDPDHYYADHYADHYGGRHGPQYGGLRSPARYDH